MASGTIALTRSGSGYLSGQIIWISTSNGTSANTSTVTATLQIKRSAANTTTGTFKGTFTVGGTSVSISSYKALTNEWVTLKTITVTVNHNTDGTGSCYIYAKIKGPSNTTMSSTYVSTTTTVDLDTIPRQATMTSATDFTDLIGPTITYTNPLGAAVPSLQVGISLDGTSDCAIAYRDVSKTAETATIELTEDELNVLYASTPTANSTNKYSRTVWIYLRTRIDTTYYYSPLSKTFTITNPEPTLDPNIVDTNDDTVSLTGNSSILVKYYSNAAITFKATALKQASVSSKKVTCGTKSLTADGTIENVESNNFIFTVTDSRGLTTTKTVTPSFVDYIKPTCNLANSMPDGEGNMTVAVTGNYFNGSFGAVSNTLTVYYRYKAAGSSYGSWTAMSVTLGNNTYSATAALTGLDYQTAYVFQAYAKDALGTVYSVEKTVKATPVFDWGENDFKFNVPVYDRFGTMFGNGIAAYTGSGDSGIDPDTTLEPLILTMLNTPMSGQFMYISTVFYNTKSTTANRAQFAIPYKTYGNMYHRCYVSGAWSEWKRMVNADDILDLVYPINSIYISYSHTSPADIFGGTWTRIEGRILYGCAESGTIGATGTHTTGSGSSSLPYVNVAIWRRTA